MVEIGGSGLACVSRKRSVVLCCVVGEKESRSSANVQVQVHEWSLILELRHSSWCFDFDMCCGQSSLS
jgi:hypothetical protein